MVIGPDGWYFSDWLGSNIRKIVPKYADDSVAETVKH
jgi:hypothetical protein